MFIHFPTQNIPPFPAISTSDFPLTVQEIISADSTSAHSLRAGITSLLWVSCHGDGEHVHEIFKERERDVHSCIEVYK